MRDVTLFLTLERNEHHMHKHTHTHAHTHTHTHAHTHTHNVHSHCSLVEGDGGRARRARECFLRSTVHYINIPPVCKERYSTQRCYSVHNKNAVVPVGQGGGSAISGPMQVEGRRVTTEV